MKPTLLTLILTILPLFADDDTFRERFADPATREAALAELIPGTREAYFHTALTHQLAGRVAEFKATLSAWQIAGTRRDQPVALTGIKTLENRQLLLDYQKSPAASLAELIRRLDLDFSDTQPDAAAAASLPTRLDPALVSEAAFEAATLQQFPQQPYTAYELQRRYRELAKLETFDDKKTRWFLENLDRADLPGVVPLVARALRLEPPALFGSVPLHQQLTSEQLAELLKLRPELASSETFARTWLAKLRPGTETDFALDLTAHAAHLRRCRDFVLTLPPALNSLKAHVLFHHLRLQASLGNYPKGDFLAFLALPRTDHSLLKIERLTTPENPIRLDLNFSTSTNCPPITDDRPLIHEFLHHFLNQTDSAADFASYLPQETLAPIHARARLLAGASPARWAAILDPVEFRQLQQETRILFTQDKPELLDSNAAVALNLDLKNTPDLLIRIYELDLPAHLGRGEDEPEVGIDLDGLVPHHQRRITFPQDPLVQHRERIDLPELSGSGAWLVDFVSGQVSARALIRKGRLIAYPDRNASAQTLRVFDEHGQTVPAAALTLGSENYTADATGLISIPDSAEHPLRLGVLAAGKLATAIELGSREDELALDARFHLDREQLLADCETKLQLRVRLTNHGHELPLDQLKNPSLILRGELLGGITTERVIAENLSLKPALEIPFQVPADLRKLTLILRATVTPPTGTNPITLTKETSYELNGALEDSTVATAFIAPTTAGHRLELRGRNGEPLASRALTLTGHRFDCPKTEIKTEVRTDAQGRVALGTLDTIDFLTVSGTDIDDLTFTPRPDAATCESDLHLTPDSVIRLPLRHPTPAPDRLMLSLVETLDDLPVRDHFGKLAIVDGQLIIRGLPPGDFRLTLDDGTTVTLLVSAGSEHHGLLVSPTRILPRHQPLHPFIATATTTADQLIIQLRDHDADTRVSLVGKRYRNDDWSPGNGLHPFAPPVLAGLHPGYLECGYLTDKLLDDEMRYILDRRAAKTFPGSMLPRPGLLLNRWQDETIEQATLEGAGGKGGGRSGSGGLPSAMRKRPGSDRDSTGPSAHSAVCDFLRQPALVHFDLTPGADGFLKLPLAAFKDCQFIEITASSPFADVTRTLPLPATEPPLRDRRLARPLDPKIHYQATQRAAFLAKGATVSIENLLDADWRAFTTLADAHQFLYGICADDRLGKFVFLTEWPNLTEARKLELLTTHACHELHLFLARKDRPFFEKHIKPFLAQKPEPTVIDDLLLGRDPTPYLRPYAWQRLNAAEKALVAQALPAARERVARELNLRWELKAPTPEQETTLFTQTLRGASLQITDSLGLARNKLREEEPALAANSAAVNYVQEKLRRIIIPAVNFEDVSVEEAVDFLRLRMSELDSIETDPARRGIGMTIKGTSGASGDSGLDAAAATPGTPAIGATKIKSLKLSNVPMGQALKYICDAAKLRFQIDDQGVINLIPVTELGDEKFTRVFQVPPGFHDALASATGSPAVEADPFAAEGSSQSGIKAKSPTLDLLKKCGVLFGPGTSVTLSPNGLMVTNSAAELDKIQQLTASMHCDMPKETPPATPGFSEADDMRPLDEPGLALLVKARETDTDGAPAADPFAAPDLPDSRVASADADPFADPASAKTAILAPRPLFRDRTLVWRESNYYGHSGSTGESLIPLNRFWLDLAAWDGKGPFLSPHFNACHSSANEALMCLALLDLPFQAGRPEVVVDGSTLRVKAREPMLLFYKDTRRADQVAPESPLLVRQTFCPLGEPFRTVAGEKVENPVTGDFRPGVPYTASLTITNPTGIGRRIDVLAQIPAGAIPLDGQPPTLSTTHELEPHGVLNLELACYFPAPGEFAVYPLHVSQRGTVLAHTAARTLRVSNKPEPRDAAAWSVLAAEGSSAEVLKRLATENLQTIDLTLIRWRLKDRGFFLKVTGVLRERLCFSPEITAYGFHHNDPASLREYLENSEAVRQLGQWLDSPLLTVRPRLHHDWQTLEFDPLVNPRAHRFTAASRLTHETARSHYHAFLDQLAWKPALDATDHLTLAAFLFLQDRVEEALARFDRIDPAKLPGRMHYDYLHTVVLCYREMPAEARAIAATTLPELPPGLWRDRFQAVVDQVDELAALTNPTAAQPPPPVLTPQLDLTMAGNTRLLVKHRSLGQATLNVFSVDLEVLFSKDPFLTGEGGKGGQPAIRPNHTLELKLAKDRTETTVELPPELRQGNLLITARSGSIKLLKVLDSAALEVRQSPQERSIQVLDAATAKPLSKTYIKVYAQTTGGAIVFHKDGYTDLRGKFDYLTHTAVDPATIKRVAILVSHPQQGARTVVYDR